MLAAGCIRLKDTFKCSLIYFCEISASLSIGLVVIIIPYSSDSSPFKIASSVSIDETIVVSWKRAVVLGRRTLNGPGAILPI